MKSALLVCSLYSIFLAPTRVPEVWLKFPNSLVTVIFPDFMQTCGVDTVSVYAPLWAKPFHVLKGLIFCSTKKSLKTLLYNLSQSVLLMIDFCKMCSHLC